MTGENVAGLLRAGRLVPDPYTDATAHPELPAGVPLIVGLAQWQAHRDALLAAGQPVGLRLRSDENPGTVAGDLQHFALVALEFPTFRDGRAFTHARLLRERFGFTGEVRAVGEVLQEQLHFMQRCGFDAFEVQSPDPQGAWLAVAADHSVWYQATGDGRPRALDRRHPETGTKP